MDEKLIEAVARLEAQVAFLRDDIREYHQDMKELAKRLSSLEHTRSWVKGTFVTAWAAILFLGWDTIKGVLTYLKG